MTLFGGSPRRPLASSRRRRDWGWALLRTCATRMVEAALLAGLIGCSDAARTESVAPPGAVSRVVLSPDSTRMDMYDTLRLSAQAFDIAGAPITTPKVLFGSTHPAVATVDGDGLVTAWHGGQTEITASVNGSTAAALVDVIARESFNVALAYGRITDRSGAPVLGSAIRAYVYFGDCTGPLLFDSKFSPNGVGTFIRRLAMPSFAAAFRGCVMLDVKPPEGGTLLGRQSEPTSIRFVDSGRSVPVDSVRIDVVLDSAILARYPETARAPRTSRMRSAFARP